MANIFQDEKDVDKKYKIEKKILDILEAWDEMVQVFEKNEKLSPTILCHEFYRKYTTDEYDKLPEWKKDYMKKNTHIYNKYKKYWDTWYEKHKNNLEKREIYGKLEWQSGIKKDKDSIFNHFIQVRQSGIRVKKSTYFPTLVAMVQTPIYGKHKRYITPRECARLQSFPESFIMHENDKIAYKQFGNAVNVDVIHLVINNVLKLYNLL